MKNATLSKKLKQYSAMAGCLLAGSKLADAQIVYTDVNPDAVSLNSVYSLDLNNDGLVDYWITTYLYSSTGTETGYVYVSPVDNNEVANVENYPGAQIEFYPAVLNAGDNIDPQLKWDDMSSQTLAYFSLSFTSGYRYTSGNWISQEKKYLGLRFNFNGELHYGWVRLSVSSEASPCTILDYAYEATPNKMIKAGDIGSVVFYPDDDGDSYGAMNAPGYIFSVSPDGAYSSVNNDCDDSNPAVHPDVKEIVRNGIDDNCDGYADESVTGIFEETGSLSFNILSNPAANSLSIQLQSPEPSMITMKVFDLSGKELYSENLGTVTGIFSKQLDSQGFSSGTYLLQVSHDGRNDVKKFVVEN
ncbi:MAG TPA: T9SS type A sorting domain-containing protein [Chitinophagales bacterium]|nr:T9SS type A sorting domain-containing protein [Chitinophagales bacterium]